MIDGSPPFFANGKRPFWYAETDFGRCSMLDTWATWLPGWLCIKSCCRVANVVFEGGFDHTSLSRPKSVPAVRYVASCRYLGAVELLSLSCGDLRMTPEICSFIVEIPYPCPEINQDCAGIASD